MVGQYIYIIEINKTNLELSTFIVVVTLVFVTARLSRSYKDFLPIPTLSNVIYQFECEVVAVGTLEGLPKA